MIDYDIQIASYNIICYDLAYVHLVYAKSLRLTRSGGATEMYYTIIYLLIIVIIVILVIIVIILILIIIL